MFRDNLRRIVEQTQGGLAALLMGFDGIPVETFVAEAKKIDIQTVGMEFSHILGQVRKAAEGLDSGSIEDVTFRAEKMTILIHILTKDYFLAVAVAPNGIPGKGRYLMRVTAPKLQADL